MQLSLTFCVLLLISSNIFTYCGSCSTSHGTNDAQLKPRHILKLSTAEKRNFLASFDHVFSDIDGVVWNMQASIPGSPEGFEALRATGKALTFITNNSVRSLKDLLDKFTASHMNVKQGDVIHPAQSVAAYLKQLKFKGLAYVIGSSYFKDVLRTAGFRVKDSPNEFLNDDFLLLLDKVLVKEPEPVRAVIIDVDLDVSYTKLIKAEIYLRDPKCLFVAGASDMLFPARNGFNVMGTGFFTTMVAEASSRQPLALGKPGRELAELVLQRYKIQRPKRALMIGDMLEQDVAFGKQCGFQTLAVLSGVSSLDSLSNQTNPQYIPDYYADSMADFLKFLKNL